MKSATWERIREQGIAGVLRMIVLVCSLALVGIISYNTYFYNDPFSENVLTQKIQFWVCIFFMADLVLEFFYTKKKARYLITYTLLFVACIPYATILPRLGATLSKDAFYFVSFMPLIRSFYALAIVVSWFAIKTSSRLFLTYMIILFSGIYLGSLGFYVCELGPNPGVKTYWDALWWAVMEAITIGCNIEAVTTGGKILSVIVGVLGLLIIPIFTVYVTNIVNAFHTVTQVAGSAVAPTDDSSKDDSKDTSKGNSGDKTKAEASSKDSVAKNEPVKQSE